MVAHAKTGMAVPIEVPARDLIRSGIGYSIRRSSECAAPFTE
jgi:hypothetical protein